MTARECNAPVATKRARGTWSRIGRALLAGVIGCASAGATLFVVDAILAAQGVMFEPMRSHASADEFLTRSEFRVRVRTNALGFREARPPGTAADGKLRVVAVGDSFTQGYGVEEDERYTRGLERLLPRRAGRDVEAINLGVPGACPLDYLSYLRRPGLDYAPDVVLVGVMANDVNDLRGLRRHGARGVMGTLRIIQARAADDRPLWKRAAGDLLPSLYGLAGASLDRIRSNGAVAHAVSARSRAESVHAPDAATLSGVWGEALLQLADRYDRRAEVQAEVARMDAATRTMLARVVSGSWRFEDNVDQTPLWRLLSMVEPRVFVDSVLLPTSYDSAWEEMTDVLLEIANTARGAGATPVIVFIPGAQQVMPEVRGFLERNGFDWDPRLLTDTEFGDRLRTFGALHDVKVIDLLEPLRLARGSGALYFVEDGHWTPAGHDVAARVIAGEMPLS